MQVHLVVSRIVEQEPYQSNTLARSGGLQCCLHRRRQAAGLGLWPSFGPKYQRRRTSPGPGRDPETRLGTPGAPKPRRVDERLGATRTFREPSRCHVATPRGHVIKPSEGRDGSRARGIAGLREARVQAIFQKRLCRHVQLRQRNCPDLEAVLSIFISSATVSSDFQAAETRNRTASLLISSQCPAAQTSLHTRRGTE